MDLGIDGRRALITGSTDGIGRAIARTLCAENCSVVLHGRDADRAEALARELRETHADVDVVLGDLGEPAAAERVAESAAQGGDVDILVANAGPFREERVLEASADDWIAAYAANALSAIACLRVLMPPMMDRGWGRVVTVGTRAVTQPLTNMATYGAAKAALVNATVAAAQEAAGTGVTVNVVSPGVILTDGLRTMLDERSDAAEDYAPNPVGRLGRPEEVAAAVAFLVSDLAAYTTGATLRVDGGITRSV